MTNYKNVQIAVVHREDDKDWAKTMPCSSAAASRR